MNKQEKQIASDLAQIWMKQGYYTGETKGLVQIGLFHALVAHRRVVLEECRKMIQKVECGGLESPQLIAGTDHRPEKLRCLREGIMAGLQGAYAAIK